MRQGQMTDTKRVFEAFSFSVHVKKSLLGKEESCRQDCFRPRFPRKVHPESVYSSIKWDSFTLIIITFLIILLL